MSGIRIPAELAAVLRGAGTSSDSVLAFFDAAIKSADVGNVDRVLDQARAGRWALLQLRAELEKARSLLGAAGMVGIVEAKVAAADFQLHPANRDEERQRDLFLRSLHAAGDHSLDPDDGDESDRTGEVAGCANTGGMI
jgi:hypothetical protein